MRRGVVVAFGGCLVALAACGGGSDAEPIVSSSATAAEVTTTPADSTSTTSTTSTTTTTEPPATTVDPTEALIADIEADLNEGEQALLTAIASPQDPESDELARKYFSGRSRDLVLAGLEELRGEGLVGRPNPDVPNVIVVREVDEVGPSGASAIVLVCRVDAAVIVDETPQGEAIVNDEITTVVSRSSVIRPDGIWILQSGEPVENLAGATACS